MKARLFLRQHENHAAVRKLRTNVRLSLADLTDLEALLASNGIGTTEDIAKAKAESEGLGIFIRSLLGLDREAAKSALGGFLTGKTLTAVQIEFINLIIDHLTEHGFIDPTVLYESPFTDIADHGPNDIFTDAQVAELVRILREVRESAMAA